MSHVATIDIEIKDLPALEQACKRLGLELVRDQKSYRWYGSHVGDYPVPEGFTVEDLGKCDHAIRVPGNEEAYEIGVVRRRDGKAGYTLLYDFYAGGRGMTKFVGDAQCSKLKQMYATTIATRTAQRQGFRVQEHVGADGRIQLRCRK
jgi:hypothetical protein